MLSPALDHSSPPLRDQELRWYHRTASQLPWWTLTPPHLHTQQSSREHVCLPRSSPDLLMLFLATAGPVGWGLSLSCVNIEQIDTKNTLGQYLCKHAVWHDNSPKHDRKRVCCSPLNAWIFSFSHRYVPASINFHATLGETSTYIYLLLKQYNTVQIKEKKTLFFCPNFIK